MSESADKRIRILDGNDENFLRSKDEEYAYWQSRPPIERLLATQQLSFASFEGHDNEAEIRQQFLRSPVCIQLSWVKT